MHAFRCSLLVTALLIACHSQRAVAPAPPAPPVAAAPAAHHAPVRQDPPTATPIFGFAEQIQTGRCPPITRPIGPLRLDEKVLTGHERCDPAGSVTGSPAVRGSDALAR